MVMKLLFTAALTLGFVGSAAHAATPRPSEFVEKAGASDTFEVDSAKLMVTSKNAGISKFATRMIADHTKSTKMVVAAAKADGLAPAAPSMTVGQRADLTALKAVPAGKTKDDLYVKQQKAAHADALSLMKDYAAHGSAAHLKMGAAKIVPVVEMHASMIGGM
jgi:putative membrane protein